MLDLRTLALMRHPEQNGQPQLVGRRRPGQRYAWECMPRLLQLLAILPAVGALTGVVYLARAEHQTPQRCPPRSRPRGARCCAAGQSETDGLCQGKPTACPAGMQSTGGEIPGCVFPAARVRVTAHQLVLAPVDWEAEGLIQARIVQAEPFELDIVEVTHERWRPCAVGGVCRELPPGEPGAPVTGVTPVEAGRFCRFVGGRLPRGDEWMLAAAGEEGRRFPWGQTGLVCRRAAFGLEVGPCGVGGKSAELAGMRPAGATPDGIRDLAGNVAEWTAEPGGRYVARGGSFRSRRAGELKTWALEERAAEPADDVGFRCAYDLRHPPQPRL